MIYEDFYARTRAKEQNREKAARDSRGKRTGGRKKDKYMAKPGDEHTAKHGQ